MRASSAIPWALWAAASGCACASWVPASPPPFQYLEPRHRDATPRARAPSDDTSDQWPHGPLSTKGRDIVNSRGDVVTWAGVNWPMSGKKRRVSGENGNGLPRGGVLI